MSRHYYRERLYADKLTRFHAEQYSEFTPIEFVRFCLERQPREDGKPIPDLKWLSQAFGYNDQAMGMLFHNGGRLSKYVKEKLAYLTNKDVSFWSQASFSAALQQQVTFDLRLSAADVAAPTGSHSARLERLEQQRAGASIDSGRTS